MHPLDLPQPRTCPSFSLLKETLNALTLRPSSFDASSAYDASDSAPAPGIANYLTTLIASPLTYLSDDEREEIWTLASARMAERAGRSGMGAMTRSFRIMRPNIHRKSIENEDRILVYGGMGRMLANGYDAVKSQGEGHSSNGKDGRETQYCDNEPGTDVGGGGKTQEERNDMIEITIHEPALTEDNLGHKTWGAAFVLANLLSGPLLPYLSFSLLYSHPPQSPFSEPVTTTTNPAASTAPKIRILELGAGTGLAGLALATIFKGVTLTLTDLPPIIPNLLNNVHLNSHLLNSTNVKVEPLDWRDVPATPQTNTQCLSPQWRENNGDFDIILAADPLYAPTHAALVSNAIAYHLRHGDDARVLIVLPHRPLGSEYHAQLRSSMSSHGLVIMGEGWEIGGEDWSGSPKGEAGDGEGVRFWWAVWSWKPS